MATIGCGMFLKIKSWNKSVSYLIGDTLNSGRMSKLLLLSLMAGFLEEIYTRGSVLLLINNNMFNTKVFALFLFINTV